ncbi:asparagine synthase (glutamine-hydrolysing) [Sphingomonas guangdongensis]|uniref:Asparagine synthase (Glutamine-hydrolysing) n=1 Tax=Sphingomonas guangdongensis TaxID=1141890 RepID=A0A285QEX5_9SPHN|nr:hypothetical protein [Sphingomonas guangdongensis]SOB78677.1 asparagine synthase (glutamine-hydrolysing) [Sphingomonas guangdongensis]
MAGLFLTRADTDVTAARARFAAQGFAAPTELAVPGWRLLHVAPVHGGPDTLLRRGADWVAVAGTLTVDDRIGVPALAALLDMAALEWDRIGGQFAAVVHRAGRTTLFTDYLATFPLHHDRDGRCFSTSLLATMEAQPRVTFDAQAVYEFAFNVVPIGDDTLFSEVKTLSPGSIVTLGADGASVDRQPRPLPTGPSEEPLADRVARQRDLLLRVVGGVADAFDDRIHCPLSGGLDSRLVLAALRASGRRPQVYVYGPPGLDDVRIARAAGEALGFAVEWINKEAAPIAPDAFAAQVAENFRRFDGYPTFGNIFDNGGHLAAYHRRHAGGALAVSGGAGEIYRDFFYLLDRPLTADAVARTFFARFTTGDATGLFEPHRFIAAIAGKIAAALDRPGDVTPLTRTEIEQIYPRVRCRALFGREIALEGAAGAYLVPFLDHRLVADALTLPMALKRAGRFEAMLIDALDPALARQPSAYGHHFAQAPTLRRRLGEWQSRARPLALRQRSYAIQRRLGPMGDEHGGELTPDYLGRVIDLDFPAMRRFFHVDRITDAGLLRRIACLEYLAAQLGGRLAA